MNTEDTNDKTEEKVFRLEASLTDYLFERMDELELDTVERLLTLINLSASTLATSCLTLMSEGQGGFALDAFLDEFVLRVKKEIELENKLNFKTIKNAKGEINGND